VLIVISRGHRLTNSSRAFQTNRKFNCHISFQIFYWTIQLTIGSPSRDTSKRFFTIKKQGPPQEKCLLSYEQKDTFECILKFYLFFILFKDGNGGKIEKKQPINQNSSLSEKNSNFSQPSQNTANRSLRQKNSKINYEKKFAEMESSPITSSMKNLKSSNEGLRKAFKIVMILKKNTNGEPFLRPVDPIALNIPDYPSIIKEPMDLGTVEKNLLNGFYKTHMEFA